MIIPPIANIIPRPLTESIGKEYNYEKNEKVTTKDIEDRIKSLCKKYKVYTEDEIRCLVATANLDYIDDSELFSVYKVNNIDALEQKINMADKLLEATGYILGKEYRTKYYNRNFYEETDYIKYDSVFLGK